MTKTWLKFSQKGQTQCCRRLVYNFGFSANTFERLMFHTSYLAQTTWYFKIAAKTTGRWATLQPVCLYQTLGMIVYSMFHYHHRLCGSASLMLTATDFVIGKGQFSTPTVSTPLNRSPNNLSQVTMSATPTAVQIKWKFVHGGRLGTWVKYNQNYYFIYTPFLGNSPAGQICRRIFTHDCSNDADSRKHLPFCGICSQGAPIWGSKPPIVGRE